MKLFFQINKKLLPDVHNCFQSHAMSPERAPTFMVCWLAPPHQEQQPKHKIHIKYMIPFSPQVFSIYIPELFTHKKGLYGTLWDAIRSYGPLLTFCS